MVQVTIDVNTGDLLQNLSPNQVRQVQRLGLEYSAQEMIRVLMRNSPVDHGLLKMWHIASQSDDEISIRSPASYAQMVNDGTSPHWIYPTAKKALYWEGAEHPVKYVYHPGTTGQHFVEDSISDVEGRLDGYFLKALSEVLG